MRVAFEIAAWWIIAGTAVALGWGLLCRVGLGPK